MKNTNEKKVAIFDVSSHLHRIYHVKKNKSENIDLLQPFINMINKELSEMHGISHFIFVFDGSSKENFRNKIYPQYKANRPPSDPHYVEQKRMVFSALKRMGAVVLCNPKYEADDIINVISNKLSNVKIKHIISTKDKDLFCLVDEYTKIFTGNGKKVYSVQDVFEDKGVFPYQMNDYLTMVGDASDNVLGIDGIGEKTAARILSEITFDEMMLDPARIKDIVGVRGAQKIIDDINNRADEIWFMRSIIQLESSIDGGIDFNLKDSRSFDIGERFREIILSKPKISNYRENKNVI